MPWRLYSSMRVGQVQKPCMPLNGLQYSQLHSRSAHIVTITLVPTASKTSQTFSMFPDRQWKLLRQLVRFRISSLTLYFFFRHIVTREAGEPLTIVSCSRHWYGV
jgi:hypothetical protein